MLKILLHLQYHVFDQPFGINRHLRIFVQQRVVTAIDVVASDGFLPVIPSPFEQGNLEDAHMGIVFVKSGACPCLIEGHERPNDFQKLLRGYGQCRRVVVAEREVGPQGMIRHNVRRINE